MKNYIVYNADGQILRTGACLDSVFNLQAGDGEWVIEGVADDLTQMIIDGVVVSKPIIIPNYDLAAEKIKKIQLISRQYILANNTSFTYGGKEYAANQNAQNNLTGISGYVAQNNALPPSFPNVWQALDGSIIGIMTVQDFKNLYAAFVEQGSINFIKYAMLESYINAASTQQELEAITW